MCGFVALIAREGTSPGVTPPKSGRWTSTASPAARGPVNSKSTTMKTGDAGEAIVPSKVWVTPSGVAMTYSRTFGFWAAVLTYILGFPETVTG